MTYWVAKLSNGTTIAETTHAWPPDGASIIGLAFILDTGQKIQLPMGMDKYIQAKTASADLLGDNITIESRYIGFVVNSLKVIIRINEKSGDISVETNSA